LSEQAEVRERPRCLVVLGPTASGKTTLGVRLAAALGGEVVSADSRQVYRGLDIGAGKDLDEYVVDGRPVPYHLIDIVDLDVEFSVFDFQQRFYRTFEALQQRGVLPVIVGGTGLYLEAVLSGYRLAPVAEDPELRGELRELSAEQLVKRLLALDPRPHNTTDLVDRDRLIRAIEIATHQAAHPAPPAPAVEPLVLGTRWPREQLRQRIRRRLAQRLDQGLIEEVEGLVARGVSWEKLHFLGLEYRYVADLVQGRIKSRNDLLQKLASAINQFAKRQQSWFRRMERRGTVIHWLDGADLAPALELARGHGL